MNSYNVVLINEVVLMEMLLNKYLLTEIVVKIRCQLCVQLLFIFLDIFIHLSTHPLLYILFLQLKILYLLHSQLHTRSECPLCYFQENGYVWERPWLAWSCFCSWPPFCRTLNCNLWLSKGPGYHCCCQWNCFCATFVPALLHSCLKRGRLASAVPSSAIPHLQRHRPSPNPFRDVFSNFSHILFSLKI